VGDAVRHDEVTCELIDRLGDVADKVRAAGLDHCIVVTDGNVLLGRVRGKALDSNPNVSVEIVMESGPTTFRTNDMLESVLARMSERNVESVLITTSVGRLVGTLYRADAERRLAQEKSGAIVDESSCDCQA
jgi:CBS domain-containing protein